MTKSSSLNKFWKGRISAQGGPASGGVAKIMYYVYIILSDKLKKKYIGSTGDLRGRFKEHNSGKSNYTAKGIPWKLIYYEAFLSKKDAITEERFLKSGKGRERIKYLFNRSNWKIDSRGGICQPKADPPRAGRVRIVWSSAFAWKANMPKGITGSNPVASASSFEK